MTGTVTVTVDRKTIHPKYKKSYRISKKYLADPNGHEKLLEGDQVIIGECRPISKNKHFKVVEIIRRVADVSDLREEADLETAMHREKKVDEKDVKKESKEEVKEESKAEPKEENESESDTTTDTTPAK